MSTETPPKEPAEASIPLSEIVAWQNEEIARINAELEKIDLMRRIAASTGQDVTREAENQQFKIRGKMEEIHGLTAFLARVTGLPQPDAFVEE